MAPYLVLALAVIYGLFQIDQSVTQYIRKSWLHFLRSLFAFVVCVFGFILLKAYYDAGDASFSAMHRGFLDGCLFVVGLLMAMTGIATLGLLIHCVVDYIDN